MKIFDYFMENPYWKSVYENAPSDECREYYKIMFEYFSFETDEEDVAGIKGADERLMELMLTREDAEYIEDHAGGSIARHQYGITIRWLFDDEKADTASASMFKGEIRNPDYTPVGMKVEEPRISSGSACFLIKDDSLKTWKGEFWDYLKKEGFSSWGVHGNWGCDWAYVNVNSKLYAPGMPCVGITQCVVSKYPRNALSIDEFKAIWEILKGHV
jgi:hypothetical protein